MRAQKKPIRKLVDNDGRETETKRQRDTDMHQNPNKQSNKKTESKRKGLLKGLGLGKSAGFASKTIGLRVQGQKKLTLLIGFRR